MGNPEPVFAARGVRLTQPPRILKEKHAKLKVGLCHNPAAGDSSSWRRAITYNVMAWRMAERLDHDRLLPGDLLDIAFSVGHNDHPEFGGLELTLCDYAINSTVHGSDAATAAANR
jgi:single-stranded-DNA-specific exonuclease